MANPSGLMQTTCILFLVLGNVLTYAAVATLRSHVSFHAFGETTRLYTSGIYGWVRNPITVGLALIYAGFFLALPSAAMLLGLIFFGMIWGIVGMILATPIVVVIRIILDRMGATPKFDASATGVVHKKNERLWVFGEVAQGDVLFVTSEVSKTKCLFVHYLKKPR